MKKKKSPFDILDQVEVIESPEKKKKPREIIPLTNPELAEEKGTKKKKGISSQSEVYRTVNIERGHPQLHKALHHLQQEINIARKSGIKVLKIIHGYGSSGKGGAMKEAVKVPLENAKSLGRIKDYIFGEDFNCFNAVAVDTVSKFNFLKHDSDYIHPNYGITIVII